MYVCTKTIIPQPCYKSYYYCNEEASIETLKHVYTCTREIGTTLVNIYHRRDVPSTSDPFSAACPLVNTVLTKMPISPLGESDPPTMLKPSDLCPAPLWNVTDARVALITAAESSVLPASTRLMTDAAASRRPGGDCCRRPRHAAGSGCRRGCGSHRVSTTSA